MAPAMPVSLGARDPSRLGGSVPSGRTTVEENASDSPSLPDAARLVVPSMFRETTT